MDKRTFIKLLGLGTAMGISQLTFGRSGLRGILAGPGAADFLQACGSGKLETVKKLLAMDSELLKAKDQIGRSGFALALLGNHPDIGDYLKESGYETDLHETALDLDWDQFNAQMAEQPKVNLKRINADHPLGGTAMWAAAAGGAGSSIWRVYAQGGLPNKNPRGESGSSPLQKALQFTDRGTAEMTAATLLGNDANPNPLPNIELPPLHLATKRGSYDLVEMLIRLGADVKQEDAQGRKAVQLAKELGHSEIEELIRKHKKISRTCRTSRYAYDIHGKPYQKPGMEDIHVHEQVALVGSSHGNIEGVKKSILTDPRLAHSVSTTSEMAVEAGAHMGRKDIVEILLEKGAPYSLPTAVMLGDITTIKKLLNEDPERIHERGAHDFALLWYPIIGQCDLAITQLLLDRGAVVEEQHNLGTTALHWAARGNSIELIELLIKNGANVNRIGRKFGGATQTPLEATQNEKVADYLRSKGAK